MTCAKCKDYIGKCPACGSVLEDTQETTGKLLAALERHFSVCTKAAAEIERLTECLKTANANHEHFERLWYLEKDKVDAASERCAKIADAHIGDAHSEHFIGGEYDAWDRCATLIATAIRTHSEK